MNNHWQPIQEKRILQEKYRNLQHTYFSPEWFLKQLPSEPHQLFESCVPNYAQSQYRFCVIFPKHLYG